jgi:diaminopimelate epimerase
MIPFTKMHGLGNSYIYIDTYKHQLSEECLPAIARQASCPNTGIGSDGLILIGPSSKASVKMRIFNKDGSEAGNCGNGLRCVAKYAFEQGLVKSKKMTIETRNRVVEAEITEHNGCQAKVIVNMGQPKLLRQEIPMKGKEGQQVVKEAYSINGNQMNLTAVSMGNPHAIFFVDHLDDNPHLRLGPSIEKSSHFPEGINVEFAKAESSVSLHCRVWERGSGETQACGTGACAVVVAAVLNGISRPKEWVSVHLAGGSLQICWDTAVLMSGPAVTVATGHFVV